MSIHILLFIFLISWSKSIIYELIRFNEVFLFTALYTLKDNSFEIKDIILDKKQENEKEEITKKNSSKNENNKNLIQLNIVKKKSSNKDYKNSNKKNNNESRTGKIVIPILNIKKSENGTKIEEKCITDHPIDNLKKNNTRFYKQFK